MATIEIDQDLKKAIPDLTLGIVHTPVRVGKSGSDLLNELTRAAKEATSGLTFDDLYAIPKIRALRDGYKAIGKDPARYRGSAEALLRRVLQGKGLYHINTVVDVNNLVSIESKHSVGSYDLANLHGSITFRIGKPGESFKGIGKETINIEELPVFADDKGPFGSPTSDSERAMITNNTHDLMTVIISFAGPEGLEQCLQRAADLLSAYSSAPREQIETYIV